MSDDDISETEIALTKEQRIMRMMKRVLTDIAKDTHTQPGMRHPLSEPTVQGMRECLTLITSREREIADALGEEMNMRPRFIDEPKKTVSVPIDLDSMRKKPGQDDD